MIIRQLESVQYDLLCHDLSANAYSLPLDPSYMVSLFLDSAEYMVKLQPEDNNRIAVLSAPSISISINAGLHTRSIPPGARNPLAIATAFTA